MRVTFSTGITVTVTPPKATRALWLAAKLAPLAALPEQAPEAVVRPLFKRTASLLARYVTCDRPAGVDLPTYLTDTALATIADWGLLGRAVLRNTPKRGTR